MEIKEVREGNIVDSPAAAPADDTPRIDAPAPEPVSTQEAASEEPEIDYQALYEKEKERLAKAEFTLYKKNKEERAKKMQTSDPSAVEDAEARDKAVEEKVLLMLEAQRQKDAEDILQEELHAISDNEDERRLIRLKYDNAINKTGYSRIAIRQDLDDARFLANKQKYVRETSELAQTLKAKKTISNSGEGANVSRPQPSEDFSKQFSRADWEFMQKRNWTPEQIKRAAQAKNLS